MATRKPAQSEPSKSELIQQLLRQNEILLKELQKGEAAPASRVQKSELPAPLYGAEKLRVGIRVYGVHLSVVAFERTYGSAFNVTLKDARGNTFLWRSTSRDVILEVGQRVVMDINPKKIDGNQVEVGYGKIRKDGDVVGPKRRRAPNLR